MPKLWYMNADFEAELAAVERGEIYRRSMKMEKINRRFAEAAIYLADTGDALLCDASPDEGLLELAKRREVKVVAVDTDKDLSAYEFTPWGWTPRVRELANNLQMKYHAPPHRVVAHVNSKLYSFALERECGIALDGACDDFAALQNAVASACPNANDKWVIKAPFGFAARDRVLGRGASIEYAQATWAQKRFAKGETLIFQPWLDVVREYGVTMMIEADGAINITGISDLQTNGAGTTRGYLLGRLIDAARDGELRDGLQSRSPTLP